MARKVEVIVGLVDKTGKGAASAKSNIGNIGKVAVVAGAAVAAGAVLVAGAVAKVAFDGVKAAISMEEQMSGIAAIFSTTVDEIKPLGDLIKDLGLNPNLKVNATEAADAIEMLGKNGLSMTEILDGAAESTVLLANSTGADFSTAANIGTDAMALFGIKAADMIEAVDGITSVTVNSKFGINDYALALAQGGGVASAVGVSFSDFNATIAGISPLFKSGSDAGTSLKTMLMRLEPQTSKAQDAMYDLGLWTEEAGSAFFDATGNMKDMGEISGLMEGAFGDLSEQQRLTAMTTIFGSDAMRAAVGMMEKGGRVTGTAAEVMEKYGVSQELANRAINDGWLEFDLLKETMSKTDALKAAATRMDNVAGAMEIFEGIVDTVKLSIGQALLPVIRRFVDSLIVLADKWLPKIEKALEVVTTVFDSFFRNLEEGMSPMDSFLEAIWDFIPPELATQLANIRDGINDFIAAVTEFITPIWEAITGFVSFKDVLVALGLIVLSIVIPAILSIMATLLPIIAIIAAVIAFVSLLRNAWETDFAGIRDFAATIWDAIKEAADAFKLLFAGDWDGFLEKIKGAWEKGWNATVAFLGRIWKIMKPKLVAMWESLKKWFKDQDWAAHGRLVVATITGILSTFWEWAKPHLVALWDGFVTWFSEQDWVAHGALVVKTITDILSTFWEWAEPHLIALWDSFATWFDEQEWIQLAVDLMTKMSEALSAFWEWVEPKLIELWMSFSDWFDAQDWRQLAIDLMVVMGIALVDFWDWIEPPLKELWTSFSEWFEEQDWKQIGIDLMTSIKDGVLAAVGALAEAAANAVRTAIAAAKGAITSGGGVPGGESAYEEVVRRIKEDAEGSGTGGTSPSGGKGTVTPAGVSSTENNYYITAKYENQSEKSLAEDLRILELLT